MYCFGYEIARFIRSDLSSVVISSLELCVSSNAKFLLQLMNEEINCPELMGSANFAVTLISMKWQRMFFGDGCGTIYTAKNSIN